MYSNEENKAIISIMPYLSPEKLKAVGENDTSSILKQDNAYTDTKSITPDFTKFGLSYSKHLENIDKKVQGEKAFMDDNKLLEIYMEKVDKDQRELRNDMKERETRIEKQISDSELRQNERMNRIEQLIVAQNEKIDFLKDKVSEQLESDKKYRHTNNIAIALGVIATVIALVGIYYATVSMITDIIGVAVK